MKKWFLALVLAALLPVLGYSQGLPDDNCYDLTLSATGRSLLFRNSTGAPIILRATYYTTGTPAGVSISLEGGNQLAATQTPTTLIAAVTNTTGANMGIVAEQYRFWYVNLGTLAGGSSPTVKFTYCLTKNASVQMITQSAVIGLGAVDAANSVWLGTNAMVFEGATADAFETSVTPIDPTADRTVSIPDATGTIVLSTAAPTLAGSFQGISNGIEFEGGTADAFETQLTVTDPTADRAVVIPDTSGTLMVSSLASNGVDVLNSVWGTSDALTFEGATADAFETSITVVDPTVDRTVTLANDSGTVMLSTLATNSTTAANSVWAESNALAFEGATADAFELRVSPTDVGADVVATLPGGANANYAIVPSTLTTNDVDIANSVWMESGNLVFEGTTADAFEGRITIVDPTGDRTYTLDNTSGAFILSPGGVEGSANSVAGANNGFTFEGATADGFETSLTAVDPTADQTVSIPNMAVNWAIMGSTLTTNAVDAANSVWALSNKLAFEGATADAFETFITPTDPTADVTVTIPNAAATGSFTMGQIEVTFHDEVTGNATDRTFFVATRGYILTACSNVFSVAAGGASKLQVTLENGVVAPGAGTNLLTNNANAGFDLAAAANTTQNGTLVAEATRTLVAGDKLSVDYADAIQATAGNMVTCSLIPN